MNNIKNKSRDISDIIPSCNLVKDIIRKKSQNFASIVYQSNYYDTTDKDPFYSLSKYEENIDNHFGLFNNSM